MTIRQEQVGAALQRAISQVLQRQLADPRIQGLVSVTKVEVSPDLHQAAVSISVLPQRFEKRTMQGLRHAAGRIRALVRRHVAMRTLPQLDFRLDASLKKQAAVLDAIRQVIEPEEPAP